MGARDPRWSGFRIGSEEFLVVSVPTRRNEWPAVLTEAERDVCERVLRGESNADIALHRGTSVRTVANQVAVAFRKLGVGSRAELAAWAGEEPGS